MRQITTLNDAYKQTFKFSIDGYDFVEIALEFKSLQYAWFITLNWGEFSLNNERVAVSPNLLRQFSKMLPFGILITGVDAVDPFSNDAWLNGWNFYMLDETDMADVEDIYVR